MKNIVLTLIAVLVVGVLTVLIFVYSGAYNVAAIKENSAPKVWLLETTLENSVASRADDIVAPDLSGEKRLLSGAAHYESMCVDCHGAPGQERAEFAALLNPEPPDFGAEPEEVQEWSAAELFWITKYGIEMTGMPGWGPSHSDEELWNMVALMQKLPEMSAAQYDALVEKAEESGHHHGGGGGNAAHGGEEQPSADHHGSSDGNGHNDAAGHPKPEQQVKDTEKAGDSPEDEGAAPQDEHDHSKHTH